MPQPYTRHNLYASTRGTRGTGQYQLQSDRSLSPPVQATTTAGHGTGHHAPRITKPIRTLQRLQVEHGLQGPESSTNLTTGGLH
jgi:hypothetical protein